MHGTIVILDIELYTILVAIARTNANVQVAPGANSEWGISLWRREGDRRASPGHGHVLLVDLGSPGTMAMNRRVQNCLVLSSGALWVCAMRQRPHVNSPLTEAGSRTCTYVATCMGAVPLRCTQVDEAPVVYCMGLPTLRELPGCVRWQAGNQKQRRSLRGPSPQPASN